MAQFEVFRKSLVPLKREPTVTVQKNGAISLNKAAHVAIGSPESVELLYDRTSRTIGFRPVDPAVDHAYAVRSTSDLDSGPFVISATAFLHFYDVQPDVSRRWTAYLVDDVLCVDLDAESVTVTSNRAKKNPVSRHRPGASHTRR